MAMFLAGSGGIMVFLTKDQKVTVIFIIYLYFLLLQALSGAVIDKSPERNPFCFGSLSTANPVVSGISFVQEKLYTAVILNCYPRSPGHGGLDRMPN